MVPKVEKSTVLQRMLESGEVHAPSEFGMPEIVMGLAPEVASLSELLLAERESDRNPGL